MNVIVDCAARLGSNQIEVQIRYRDVQDIKEAEWQARTEIKEKINQCSSHWLELNLGKEAPPVMVNLDRVDYWYFTGEQEK